MGGVPFKSSPPRSTQREEILPKLPVWMGKAKKPNTSPKNSWGGGRGGRAWSGGDARPEAKEGGTAAGGGN